MENWHELHKILLSIARRKIPSANNWGENLANNKGKCFICDKIISSDFEVVEEHGVQHLKERNLLPFI